jgi:hypothetical protein
MHSFLLDSSRFALDSWQRVTKSKKLQNILALLCKSKLCNCQDSPKEEIEIKIDQASDVLFAVKLSTPAFCTEDSITMNLTGAAIQVDLGSSTRTNELMTFGSPGYRW